MKKTKRNPLYHVIDEVMRHTDRSWTALELTRYLLEQDVFPANVHPRAQCNYVLGRLKKDGKIIRLDRGIYISIKWIEETHEPHQAVRSKVTAKSRATVIRDDLGEYAKAFTGEP